MAHKEQNEFFQEVKKKFPKSFENVKVIDCGSLDVNGSLADLFWESAYIGVDIVEGKNVDMVQPVHTLKFENYFDTVISAEMLEHDEHWKESLLKMHKMAKPGGLVAISCAGKGRAEHGTTRTGKGDIWGTSPDYYRNVTEEDILDVYDGLFEEYECRYEPNHKDTYFWGIKHTA
jgi:SAM-dependent methyltransferase